MTDTEILTLAAKTYKQGWKPSQGITCDGNKKKCCVLGAVAVAKGFEPSWISSFDLETVIGRSRAFTHGVMYGFDGDNVVNDYSRSRKLAFERGLALGRKALKKFVK